MTATLYRHCLRRAFSILALASFVLSLLQPVAVKAAPPDPVKPAAQPANQGAPLTGKGAPPKPGEVQGAGKTAQDAIDAALKKYVDYLGPRYAVDGAVKVQVNSKWAYGAVTLSAKGQAKAETLKILAEQYADSSWAAFAPQAEEEYFRVLDKTPSALIPTAEKAAIKTQIKNKSAQPLTPVQPGPASLTTFTPDTAAQSAASRVTVSSLLSAADLYLVAVDTGQNSAAPVGPYPRDYTAAGIAAQIAAVDVPYPSCAPDGVALSPRKTKLAFTLACSDAVKTYVVDLKTKSASLVGENGDFDLVGWLSDDTTLVLRETNLGVLALSSDQKTVQYISLPNINYDAVSAAVEPDGAAILYTTVDGLWRYTFAGKNLQQLAPSSADGLGSLKLSPDGTTLVYTAAESADGSGKLWIAQKPFANPQPAGVEGVFQELTWGHSGGKLAILRRGSGSSSLVSVYDAHSKANRAVANLPAGRVQHVAWSADDSALLLTVKDAQGGETLWSAGVAAPGSSAVVSRIPGPAIAGPGGASQIQTTAPDTSRIVVSNSPKSAVAPAVAMADPPQWWVPFDSGQTWSITAGYSPTGGSEYHKGTDYYAMDFARGCDVTCGQTVRASAGGTYNGKAKVIETKTTCQPGDTSNGCSYGNFVRLDHGNGFITRYAHLQSVSVNQDQEVCRGQEVGKVGNTGNVFGSCATCGGGHLHFVGYSSGAAYKLEPLKGDKDYTGIAQGLQVKSATTQECSGGGGTDTTKPDGDFSTPSQNQTVTSRSVHISGWASDSGGSGFDRAHFTVTWPGSSWHQIGPDFNSSPFGFDWDMCNDGVPNGQTITLGLDIWDKAGNSNNSPHGNRTFTKNVDCTPPSSTGTWKASYYDTTDRWNDNNNGNNLRCSEDISGPTLDKDYADRAPCGGMDGDTWVGDYSAKINFPSGTYVFQVDHDDGMKLWLNGGNIGDFGGSGSQNVCPPRTLSGDNDLRVMLREDGGSARVRLTWTTDTSLCNTNHAPSKPSPSSPGDWTEVTGQAPTLCWSGSTDSDGDAIQYWAEVFDSAVNANSGWTTSTCWRPSNLDNQFYSYQWRVKAVDSKGAESGWSDATWHFTIRQPNASCPALTGPGDNAVVGRFDNVTLTWNGASGASQYLAEFWGGPDLNLNSGWTSGTSFNVGSSFWGGKFQWKVTPKNSAGQTTNCDSQTRTLIRKYGPPGGLAYSGVTQTQAVLSWSASADAPGNIQGYRIYRDGSPINTTGSSETAYTDGSLSCGSSYRYTVRAYKDDLESDDSSAVTVNTSACPPSDTTSPVINWVEPVGNSQTFDVYGDPVLLRVDATDNVGVQYVHFERWDAVNQQYIDLGDVDAPPYALTIDTSAINYDWNYILATAYDGAENGASQYIYLYNHPPKPDLAPFAPEGYPDAVIPSLATGTHQTSWLASGEGVGTFFDWHFINAGKAEATGDFYVELWVDGTRFVRYPYSAVGPGGIGGFDDWREEVKTPGWHTVMLIVDPDNTIDEADESNNVWQSDFYWNPSAPYMDDMESDPVTWSADGLWHLIDSSNPYFVANNGGRSWWYGQDSTGTYSTGAQTYGSLTSAPVYIPAGGPYYLRYDSWYQTESQAPDWDRRIVLIAVDGGPFETVRQQADDPMERWITYPPLDLAPYAGHFIQVAFLFDSVDGYANDYRGWYIDDLDISANPPPACSDANEPNNTPAQAGTIGYEQTVTADLCPAGDYDYYKFYGTAADPLVIDIDAAAQGSQLDAYLTLYNQDLSEVLKVSDDDSQTQDSKIGLSLPYTGWYYLRVREYNHAAEGGSDYWYSLRLFTDGAAPAEGAISAPQAGAWIDPAIQTISATAGDAESGIQRVEFLWHSADWDNTGWIWLGADNDGRDGWSYALDTSVEAEQQGAAVYAWAFDYAGNYTGFGSWGLGIDRTPPTAAAAIYPMYGGAAFRDFWVEWSNSTDNLSGIASYDVQYRDGANGAWTDWQSATTNLSARFVGVNGHTYYFRTRALDNAGNQSAYASGNGDTAYTVNVCAAAADAYEADNTYTQAKTITPGAAAQAHNFHVEGDADWLKFTTAGNTVYTIETANTGGYADTVLDLYQADGTTLITENDDLEAGNIASRIQWSPSAGGTYYIKVSHWDTYAAGCSTAYTVQVTSVSAFCSGVSEIPAKECMALETLYKTNGGLAWNNNSGWVTTNTPCSWAGVSCAGGHVSALDLSDNNLSGALPGSLTDLSSLSGLSLGGNELTGAVPAALGSLTGLSTLDLSGNNFSGPLPAELGKLTGLATLRLENNALSGAVPAGYTALTNLDAASTGLGYNSLTASGSALVAFLNSKDADWSQTQTIPPANLRLGRVTAQSVELLWDAIPYTADGGYYEIRSVASTGGPFEVAGLTANKAASRYEITGLTPGQSYTFKLRAYTPAHGAQKNDLWSADSATVTANAISNPLPALAAISPSSASAGQGDLTLTLSGSNFISGSTARWNGADLATTFVSPTELTARIPAARMAAGGTAAVTVFNPAPGGGISASKTFTVNNPQPSISGLAPDSAPAGSYGFSLAVSGANFVPGAVVKWGSRALSTTYQSAAQLVAIVPADALTAVGPVGVTVVNPAPGGGASAPATFNVVNPAPVIDWVSPTQVRAGSGDFKLTVGGAHFASGAVVRWNGIDLPTTYVSAGKLEATVVGSLTASAGTATIEVANPAPGGGVAGGFSVTISDANPLPVVESISPASVSAGGAAFTLTVSGTDFTAASQIAFGGSLLKTTFTDSTQLSAQIPADQIATGKTITVQVFTPTPGGGASKELALTVNNPQPRLDSVTADSATLNSAEITLVLKGAGFVTGSTVLKDGAEQPCTFVSGAELRVTVPRSALEGGKKVTFTVVNGKPGGGASAAVAFRLASSIYLPLVTK